MKIFLRVWLFEREVVAIHFTTEEPVVHIESGDDPDELDREEFEPRGSAAFAWSATDSDDGSHLVLSPVSDESDSPG